MSQSRKQFSATFKLRVLAEIQAGKSIAEATREYGLSKNTIYKWQQLHERYQELAFAGQGNAYTIEARIRQMEQVIGQLTIDNQLLKKSLRQLRQDMPIDEAPARPTDQQSPMEGDQHPTEGNAP